MGLKNGQTIIVWPKLSYRLAIEALDSLRFRDLVVLRVVVEERAWNQNRQQRQQQ